MTSNIPSNLVTKLRELHKFWHETDELKDAADEIERLMHESKWGQHWHRLVESIATILEVNSAGGFAELAHDIPAAIERLRSEIRAQHAAYSSMFDKAAELERKLSGDPSAHETKAQSTCIDCLELKNALAAAVRIANEARECHDRDQDMRVMKILLALSGHIPKWRADTDRIHDVLKRVVGRLDSAQETCPHYWRTRDNRCRLPVDHTGDHEFPGEKPEADSSVRCTCFEDEHGPDCNENGCCGQCKGAQKASDDPPYCGIGKCVKWDADGRCVKCGEPR